MNKKLLILCIFVCSALDLQANQSLEPQLGPKKPTVLHPINEQKIHPKPALTIIYSGGLGGNISSCG